MCKINSLILALLLLLFYSSSEINAQTEVGTFYAKNTLIHTNYKQKFQVLQKGDSNLICPCLKATDYENYNSNTVGTQVKFSFLGITNNIHMSYTNSKFTLKAIDGQMPSRILTDKGPIDAETAIRHESFYEIQNVRIDFNQEFELISGLYLSTGLGSAVTFKENNYHYSLEDFGKNYPLQFEQRKDRIYLNNGRTQEIYRVSGSESNVNPIHIYANFGIGYNFDFYGVIVNPFIQTNLMLNQFNKTTPWRVSMISSGIAFRYGI